MLGKLARLLRSPPPPAPLDPRLERIVTLVGHSIQDAEDFSARAIAAAEFAISYFDRQLAAIPGELPVSLTDLQGAGQASALFPEEGDLLRALGRSLAVKDELPDLVEAGHETLYALLGVRQRPGTPRQTQFTDHTVRSLGATPDEVRQRLKLAAYERLLKEFAEHVETLRRKERLLTIEWEWNQRHDAPRPQEAGDRPEFVYAAQELTPPKLLQGLIDRLHSPTRYISLDGVRSGTGASEWLHGELPRLRTADRREWQVCIVAIPIADALHALAAETHNHRYLFI